MRGPWRALPFGPATLLVLLFLLMVEVVSGAPVADASTIGPTDWRSVLVSVAPTTSAVRVEVFAGGEAIRIVAAPGHTVTIPGYDGEPYLRITADGTVEENRNSPTWWSNRSSTGGAPAPTDLPTDPDWVRIGTGGGLTWHDHRIHAMPGVTTDTDWTVTFDVDGLPHTARGRLTELPSHTPAVEVLVALVVLVAVWFVGPRRPRTTTGAAMVAAASLATAIAIGETVATPPGLRAPTLHLVVAVGGLVLAVIGVALGRRRPRPATVVLVAAIAAIAWWWALMVPALTAAIVPNAFDDTVVRIGLGIVAGLVIAAAALLVATGAFAGTNDQSPDVAPA